MMDYSPLDPRGTKARAQEKTEGEKKHVDSQTWLHAKQYTMQIQV